jgi:ribosomal protein S18 acetylase RimI-like enzyme
MRIARITVADLPTLLNVAPGLFDAPIRPDQARAFLDNPMNELFLAFDGDLAVGMVTATVLQQPDKAPSLFINELGTRESHQRRGIATALMVAMLKRGRARGCEGIWLGTEPDNAAALALYRKLGATERGFVGFGWDDGL